MLAGPGRPFCFSSLVVLCLVCGCVMLFLVKIENKKKYMFQASGWPVLVVDACSPGCRW